MATRIPFQVPYGVTPGERIPLRLSDGRMFRIRIPEGAYYPDTLMLNIPPKPESYGEQPGAKPPAEDLDSSAEDKISLNTTQRGGVDVLHVKPCMALPVLFVIPFVGETMCNLYCPDKWQKMCGMYTKGELLCLQCELQLCKVGACPDNCSACCCGESYSCCMFCQGELECIKPTTLAKLVGQLFCLDLRVAAPCDKEVPCAFTLCGLTLCAADPNKIGGADDGACAACCPSEFCTFGNLGGSKKDEEGGAPATTVDDIAADDFAAEESEMQTMER